MSSNARKTVPPGVLAHPAISILVAQASATSAGTITPDELRQAAEDAGVEPRHLKALMTHLAGLGISVALPVDARVLAATTTKKATTAKAAKAAPAKKAAAKAETPEIVSADEKPLPAGAHAATEDGEAPRGYKIKGNADSGLYHVPGSAFYDRTVAEIWFKTAEDAEAAGFELPPSQRDEPADKGDES